MQDSKCKRGGETTKARRATTKGTKTDTLPEVTCEVVGVHAQRAQDCVDVTAIHRGHGDSLQSGPFTSNDFHIASGSAERLRNHLD